MQRERKEEDSVCVPASGSARFYEPPLARRGGRIVRPEETVAFLESTCGVVHFFSSYFAVCSLLAGVKIVRFGQGSDSIFGSRSRNRVVYVRDRKKIRPRSNIFFFTKSSVTNY